ncbi:hypothetical protein BCR35DRAFT_301887 [Leucosporidium creatinivorum]|uniref:Poly(A) RNA polymerase mitochondrial-like central palm domain-containing protein n=1 Tax=Leucosporidium creatinivorum TaxID=106004 RepID=A0A1Y2FWE8_9BASI|nr:hypothetical protein BCR35DRAFT_301887 [Leucosporidium creatinivorum]
MLRLALRYTQRQPALRSLSVMSNPSAGGPPSLAPPVANGSGSTPSSQPSKRHRNRKPAAQRAAAAAATSASETSAAQADSKGPARVEGHWRGGSNRGSTSRGRGSSSGRGRGGGATAATRSFSSGRDTTSSSTETEDLGRRVATVGLRPATAHIPPPPSLTTPSTRRDFSTTTRKGFEAPRTQGPPVGNPPSTRRDKAKAKGRQPPLQVGGGSEKVARNQQLLERIRVKEGEEGGFNEEVERLFEAQRASPEALTARQYLITELESFFNRCNFRWGHPHNTTLNPIQIEAFGSVRFGLATSNSDLDLCLFDPYRPNGFEDKWFSSKDSSAEKSKLPDIYDMRVVGNKLRQAGLSKVHPIPFAGVPIVKFEAQIGDQLIQADINTNERLGVLNSRLLNAYCSLHPSIRPLCVFLKFWASQRDLNDPSGQTGPVTLSSYTLILLVIAYLQHIKLVPNLQDADLIEKMGTERRRFFSTPKARLRRGKMTGLKASTGWDTTFVEVTEGENGEGLKELGWEVKEVELKELARGFFEYYAGGEGAFDMHGQVVSVKNGAPMERKKRFGGVREEWEAEEEAAALKAKIKRLRKGLADGEISAQEKKRQEDEDDLLAAFAQEPTTDPSLSVDHDLVLDLGNPPEPDDVRNASRSSSPFLYDYDDFEEPGIWSKRPLVVQDPFDLTRNTAGNIEEDVIDALQAQMAHAHALLSTTPPASLALICSHISTEAGYQSLHDRRKNWRKDKVKKFQAERSKAAGGGAPSAVVGANEMKQQEEVAVPTAVEEELEVELEGLNLQPGESREVRQEEDDDDFSAAFAEEDEERRPPVA